MKKIEVDEEKIVFKFISFSITIPKQDNEIEYNLFDLSKTVGIPIRLILTPRIYKTSLWGKINMALYYFFASVEEIASPLLNKNSLTEHALTIEGKNEIEQFLSTLDNFKYDIAKPLKMFNELLNEPSDPKFIPGTNERKNDRLILMVIIFLFLEGMFSFVFFIGSKNISKDLPVFTLITITIAFFCSAFYFLIRKK